MWGDIGSGKMGYVEDLTKREVDEKAYMKPYYLLTQGINSFIRNSRIWVIRKESGDNS